MNLSYMTPKHWLAAIAVLVVSAGAGGYWTANYRAHHAPMTSTSGDRKVLYWHDPMVPDARFDQPGKSPFMDMQLVPVYADDSGSDTGVRIAPNVSQNLGIRLGKVETATFDRILAAVGSVAFDERLLAVVPARVELENPETRLAPGMFVSLRFSAPNREPQLVVPSEAVIQTGERSVVIVVNQDGSFGVANVTTGGEADGRTAILQGLSAGQPIVLSGQFLIDSEASLKSAVSRFGATSEGRKP